MLILAQRIDWKTVKFRNPDAMSKTGSCKKTERAFFKNYYYYEKCAYQAPLITPIVAEDWNRR